MYPQHLHAKSLYVVCKRTSQPDQGLHNFLSPHSILLHPTTTSDTGTQAAHCCTPPLLTSSFSLAQPVQDCLFFTTVQ